MSVLWSEAHYRIDWFPYLLALISLGVLNDLIWGVAIAAHATDPAGARLLLRVHVCYLNALLVGGMLFSGLVVPQCVRYLSEWRRSGRLCPPLRPNGRLESSLLFLLLFLVSILAGGSNDPEPLPGTSLVLYVGRLLPTGLACLFETLACGVHAVAAAYKYKDWRWLFEWRNRARNASVRVR